jgi:single-strand DNA-binding protein
MFNKVVIAGNLTRDPELRYTAKGTPVCNMSVALNSKYGDTEEVYYADVVVWGKQAESVQQYLSKGRQCIVEGRLTKQEWESDGQKRSKTVITASAVKFIGSKQASQEPPAEVSDIEPF